MGQQNNSSGTRGFLIGILGTIIGGVILAYIIQDARFDPNRRTPATRTEPPAAVSAPSPAATSALIVNPSPEPLTTVPTAAPPTATRTPEPPTPTFTPSPTSTPEPKVGDVLYEADWSIDANGWAGTNNWKYVSSMLVNDGGHTFGSGVIAPYTPGNITDYAVEAEVQYVGLGQADCAPFFGIFGRARNFPDVGYRVGYLMANCFGSDEVGIYKNNERSAIAQQYFNRDKDWHVYRAEFQGNAIRLMRDGGLLIEATDNQFLEGGQVGLWCAGAQINVRSFKVIKL
jgi:hypothetical protein